MTERMQGQKKSQVSGHRSVSKLVRWPAFFCNLFFIQSMVAKRGLTNRANVHTPMWKSHLKNSTAEFQSIQQFWLQLDIAKKIKK